MKRTSVSPGQVESWLPTLLYLFDMLTEKTMSRLGRERYHIPPWCLKDWVILLSLLSCYNVLFASECHLDQVLPGMVTGAPDEMRAGCRSRAPSDDSFSRRTELDSHAHFQIVHQKKTNRGMWNWALVFCCLSYLSLWRDFACCTFKAVSYLGWKRPDWYFRWKN